MTRPLSCFNASCLDLMRKQFGDGPIGFERTGETSHDAMGHRLCLLFTKGKRPDRADLHGFSEKLPYLTVSHDPEGELPVADRDASDSLALDGARKADLSCKPAWLELLRDGLTFDCVGLAPREQSVIPFVDYRFDINDEIDFQNFESVMLTPGSHLHGGGNSLPVLRGLMALACDFLHHFADAKIVCWPPSQSAIGRRFFESTVTAWLDGGPFPALGLTAFAHHDDGTVTSVGLSHFIGQDICIEPELTSDKLAVTRLGLRLINQLILVGGIDHSERIVGPDGGRLLLSPSRNGKFVRVSRE